MPPDWQLSVQPYFFNHTDIEKITGAIATLSQDFVVIMIPKTFFSVGVKIYPFDNRFNSIRIVIVKMSTKPSELRGKQNVETNNKTQGK